MELNNENEPPHVNDETAREAPESVVSSPIAPRFAKETLRGAKRALDVPRFHQELQKKKMVGWGNGGLIALWFDCFVV